MPLPGHKTRIVGTIGPAPELPELTERMIRAGMDMARLNFSHRDLAVLTEGPSPKNRETIHRLELLGLRDVCR